MTFPHIELGNTEKDIGSEASSFIKGLMDERARREQVALQKALADARAAEIAKPQMSPITTPGPAGLVHGLMNRDTGVTSLASGPAAAAPDPQQYVAGLEGSTPVGLQVPRNRPGAATPIPMPEGVTPKPDSDQRFT